MSRNNSWLQGLLDCEQHYQNTGIVPEPISVPIDSPDTRLDYCGGWNCYRIHVLGTTPQLPDKLTARLARIDLAYARLAVSLDYGSHSELSVLASLQRLKQRRLKARTNAMRYYHVNS